MQCFLCELCGTSVISVLKRTGAALKRSPLSRTKHMNATRIVLGLCCLMLGAARSASGRLRGPWVQQAAPLFAEDGGHGMIFRRFDGQLMLVLHQPNKERERARLFELEDAGDTLRIKSPFPTNAGK